MSRGERSVCHVSTRLPNLKLTVHLQQIAIKEHVWTIESYNYSNGTVKAARAICPGNLDTARAETNRRMYRVIY